MIQLPVRWRSWQPRDRREGRLLLLRCLSCLPLGLWIIAKLHPNFLWINAVNRYDRLRYHP